jgi:hypothetical protein
MRAAFVALCLALVVPALPSSVADGCTFVAGAYACSVDAVEGEDCSQEGATGTGITAVGAGIGGLVGAGAAGVATCGTAYDEEYVVVTASVGATYVNAVWVDERGPDGEACFVTVLVGGVGQTVGCVAGGPPDPGWGHLLP